MNSTENCSICNGEFYTAKMTNGKCEVCHARFPDVKDKAELLQKREEAANKKYNDGNFDNRVTSKVNEILKEHNILLECKCGELYHKRSPAQKTCGNCGDKK